MKKIFTIAAILLLNFSFNETGNTEQQLNEKAYSKAISGLYVRKSPSAKSEAIGLIKYNTSFIIIEYSKTEEKISGIKAPWIKIKVLSEDPQNTSYDPQAIEGWIFGGFIDKNELIKNSELINDEKTDFNTVIKLLDKKIYIELDSGTNLVSNLYFIGDKVVSENSFFYLEDGAGGVSSSIGNVEYKKDSVILKIKQESGEESTDGFKITKTEFFKCIITKKTVLDIYNKNEDQNRVVKCILIK